jgi:hypothetical protein
MSYFPGALAPLKTFNYKFIILNAAKAAVMIHETNRRLKPTGIIRNESAKDSLVSSTEGLNTD